MGQLLSSVVKSEDRGLVGRTGDEKEILLSDSIPQVRKIRMNLENPDEVEYNSWLDEQYQQIAKDCGNGVFVRIVEADSLAELGKDKKATFFYHVYRRRA